MARARHWTVARHFAPEVLLYPKTRSGRIRNVINWGGTNISAVLILSVNLSSAVLLHTKNYRTRLVLQELNIVTGTVVSSNAKLPGLSWTRPFWRAQLRAHIWPRVKQNKNKQQKNKKECLIAGSLRGDSLLPLFALRLLCSAPLHDHETSLQSSTSSFDSRQKLTLSTYFCICGLMKGLESERNRL